MNWCSQNQDPVFRKQLIAARQTPPQEVQDALMAEINTLQLKYGLSEQLCLCEGCRERALQSQVVCVKHFLGDKRWERGWRSDFHSLLYDS
ncbi:MAG: hypothetical protein V7K67_25305 [Nostoc sp.]|uniref:hypothetical protein n=1 Tax=Nostoc sp. TaxID=1180 RepID=UPI002FF99402